MPNYWISCKNRAILWVKFHYTSFSTMYLSCHDRFRVVINHNMSMFEQSLLLLKMFINIPLTFFLLLNLQRFNRNTISNGQLLLDSSFQHLKLQNYQTRNSAIRLTQQTISNLDNLFVCSVSPFLCRKFLHFIPSLLNKKKNKRNNVFKYQSNLSL